MEMAYHQRQGDCGKDNHHQGLCARGHGSREGRKEGRDGAPRISRARGAEREVPQVSQFKRAFEAQPPGRQWGYLYHFASAKQSATRTARIEKAMPAIFKGRGFLERR